MAAPTPPASAPPPAPPPRLVIDRRPLAVVLASRFRPQIYLAFIGLAFAALLQLEPPTDLDVVGWRALCLFALCVSLWVTALIPLAITSLLAIALVPLLGITDAGTAYGYFGNKAVFFVLGAFTLSAAVVACGLSTRLTMVTLERFAKSPRALVGTIFGFTALGSCVMSEHAVAAMAFPIVWELTQALKLRPGTSQLGKAMFFALAWGCVAGGSLTLLGGGRGPLAIGILEETTGGAQTISFLEYVLFDWPFAAALLLTSWLLLRRFTPELDSVAHGLEVLEEKLRTLGKVTLRERLVGAVMGVTIGLWAFAGDDLGIANIAIVCTAALFALQLVSWRDIEENVNWGVLLMYGGAITLGSTMANTGAAHWLTQSLFGDWAGPASLLMLAVALVSGVLTEFMSNAAVIAIVTPAALSVADSLGLDARAMTMSVVLPSNLAFSLPMATAATAMAYSAGYFTPREAIKNGLLLDGAGLLGMAALVYLYWPLLRHFGLM